MASVFNWEHFANRPYELTQILPRREMWRRSGWGGRRWEEISDTHRQQSVGSPWFNRHLQIRLGNLFFQLCCGTREASRILMRRNSWKVGREKGAGRHSVVSIWRVTFACVKTVNLIKSEAGKVLKKAGTRALREGEMRDGHMKPQSSSFGSDIDI